MPPRPKAPFVPPADADIIAVTEWAKKRAVTDILSLPVMEQIVDQISKMKIQHLPENDEPEPLGQPEMDTGVDDDEEFAPDAPRGEDHPVLDQERFVEFLEQLGPTAHRLHNVQFYDELDDLAAGIEPMEHQKRAAAAIRDSMLSQFRGIIVGDPPGLGKTLSAAMAINRTPTRGRIGALVLAPSSCTHQWEAELNRMWKPGTMKTIVLSGRKTQPTDLKNYDIVIASYSFISAEYGQHSKWKREVDMNRKLPGHKRRKQGLSMPQTTLISQLLEEEDVVFNYLILDEAQEIKNTYSRLYAAVAYVRWACISCVMLSGTPFDNHWDDITALLTMLDNHPLLSIERVRQAFTHDYKSGRWSPREVPYGVWLRRAQAFLRACMIIRPEQLVTAHVPALVTRTLEFDLSAAEARETNEAIGKFKEAQLNSKRAAEDGIKRMTKKERKKEKVNPAGLGDLIKAQQHNRHPDLRIFKHQAGMPGSAGSGTGDSTNADSQDLTLGKEGEIERKHWKMHLQKGDNRMSSRTKKVVKTVVNHHAGQRTRGWDDVFLVIDEYPTFLDAVEVGLRRQGIQLPITRYDSSQLPIERKTTLANFKKASGPRVMLASRATGGQGLNIQCANVMILCVPMWKMTWQKQCLGRVYRLGQTNPVYEYILVARNSNMDRHIITKRDEKDAVIREIQRGVICRDDEALEPLESLRE